MNFLQNRAALAAILLLAGALAACGSHREVEDHEGETPIRGPRISVMAFDNTLETDNRLKEQKIVLPAPRANADWAQAGGGLRHDMGQLELSGSPRKIWESSIGRGSSRTAKLYGEPVTAGGMIYTIDPASHIAALDAGSGRKVWETRIVKPRESSDTGAGGGVSSADGKLYATTGYGIVAAFDARTGRKLWQQDVGIPLRGAPTATTDTLFVITHDNQMLALSTADGAQKWSHGGIPENAAILGTASPAVADDMVIVPYSSGELFALNTDTGQPVWTNSVSRGGQLTPLSTLNDIDGEPVIDDGRVYAISQSGRMVAIDLRSGERLWENNIGGVHTPWVAGDYIFVVTNDNQVVALRKADGRIRWITQLSRFQKPKKRKNLIQWTGPLLAGDRLVVASSEGYALSISPYTGKIISGTKLGDKIFITPIAANGTLFVTTDNGKIIALR